MPGTSNSLGYCRKNKQGEARAPRHSPHNPEEDESTGFFASPQCASTAASAARAAAPLRCLCRQRCPGVVRCWPGAGGERRDPLRCPSPGTLLRTSALRGPLITRAPAAGSRSSRAAASEIRAVARCARGKEGIGSARRRTEAHESIKSCAVQDPREAVVSIRHQDGEGPASTAPPLPAWPCAP